MQKQTLQTTDNARNWLASNLKGIAASLPEGVTTPERMARVALTAMTKTPKLLVCKQETILDALMTCSQLGIEPDNRRAYLIPYGDTCQLIVSYQGLAELIRRSGEVKDIHCDTVHENDEFEENLGQVVVHRVNRKEPRGEIYAAYSRVILKDGTISCEIMSKDEIEAIRRKSKAGNSGPWKDHFGEMAKKTVFRRHSKWLPLSPEVKEAFDKDADQLPEIRRGEVTNERTVPTNPGFSGPSGEPETEQEPEIEEPEVVDRDALCDWIANECATAGINVEQVVRFASQKGHAQPDDLLPDLETNVLEWIKRNFTKIFGEVA